VTPFRPDGFVPPRAWNWALIAPADRPIPGAYRQAPAFPVGVDALRRAVLSVAAAQARTELLAEDPGAGRLEFRARSRFLGAPDLITVILMAGEGTASLALFSRARYGAYDFGVNRHRVERWLKAISAAL